MIIDVLLDRIDANPWQPRQREDQAHVIKVAESIASQGLMQAPAGRVIAWGEVQDLHGITAEYLRGSLEDGFHRVQLAFGHTRLAAFRLLARIQEALMDGKSVGDDLAGDEFNLVLALADEAVESGRSFQRMPVQLLPLSDEAMFAQGVQENIARKDLTAIEEAKAMKRYADEFGKNSVQIGALFGLNDSTVRNKMRLLDLPEDIQARAEGLPEGIMRELVSMYALPVLMRTWRPEPWMDKFDNSVARAFEKGKTAQEYADDVRRFVESRTKDLSQAPWKHDVPYLTDEGGVRACKGCEMRFVRAGKQLCMGLKCYQAHEANWQLEYLAEASQACGIPVGDEKLQGQREYSHNFSTFEYQSELERLKQIIATRCSNLRLYYNDRVSPFGREREDVVPGFRNAQIVCQKRSGFCTCSNALKVTGTAGAIQDAAAAVSAETGEPAENVLSEERLKEIARETRQQKRHNLEVVQRMRQDAIMALEGEIETAKFWQELGKAISFTIREKVGNERTLTGARAVVIGYMLDNWLIPDGPTAMENPEGCEKRYNEFLARFNKQLSFSIIGDEPAVDAGRTLVDVFAEQIAEQINE